jgi:hypothetical protein
MEVQPRLDTQRRERPTRSQPPSFVSGPALRTCFLAAMILPPLAKGQFCLSFDNTWAGFVTTIRDSGRFALLCPFEISGNGCPLPSGQKEEEGFVVPEGADISIVCDPSQYGFDLESACVINCSGRHFTVRPHSKLTLDRMALMGSTDSSIKVQSQGEVSLVNSIFEK